MNFLQATTLLFVYLKLTYSIQWSWMFVLAPMIIDFGYGCYVAYNRIKYRRALRDLTSSLAAPPPASDGPSKVSSLVDALRKDKAN